MAGFLSLMLAISVVGLIVLIALKRYEMATGHVLLGGMRPKVGSFFHRALHLFERGVPGAARRLLGRGVSIVRVQAQQTLARAIVVFEHNLEKVLHTVRQQSQMPRGEGAASQFLQEVAAHKQQLLKRAPSRRMIFDDN